MQTYYLSELESSSWSLSVLSIISSLSLSFSSKLSSNSSSSSSCAYLWDFHSITVVCRLCKSIYSTYIYNVILVKVSFHLCSSSLRDLKASSNRNSLNGRSIDYACNTIIIDITWPRGPRARKTDRVYVRTYVRTYVYTYIRIYRADQARAHVHARAIKLDHVNHSMQPASPLRSRQKTFFIVVYNVPRVCTSVLSLLQ